MGRSCLYLAKLDSPPATLLDHLITVFPLVTPLAWRDRFQRGLVTTHEGQPFTADSPYRQGTTIYYMRESASEPATTETETIIYEDSSILVADKPHGMPVTPSGDYVQRSLLFRLQKSTGLEDLSPAHRLDKDTAGLVLFSKNRESRSQYHQLFAKVLIAREYLAVAHLPEATDQKQWLVENRIASGTPWFLQQIVEGTVNAVTPIELLKTLADRGLFRLKPTTGKKHQLRLHMASIGAPIVGDPYYPQIREKTEGELPLQLLAHRLTFVDPISGVPHTFESTRTLSLKS